MIIAQDTLDGSEMRRGKASWPAQCGLGLCATNDATLLETGLYQLLKLHFRDHPCYLEILEIFHDVNNIILLPTQIRHEILASVCHVSCIGFKLLIKF